MDKIHCLADHRHGLAHKSGKAEFGRQGAVAVKQHTAGRRAEKSVVGGQGGAQFCKKIGSLQKFSSVITIDQSIRRAGRTANNFLKT